MSANPDSQIPGTVAGTIGLDGYRYIRIDGVDYRADALAWLLVYGEPVPERIEHINGDREDNRIANLRDGDHPDAPLPKRID